MTPAEDSAFTSFLLQKAAEAEAIGYRPTKFKSMLNSQGGNATVRQLLAKNMPSEGFTRLFELGRLDLTVEALIVETKWRLLVDPIIVKHAERLLTKSQYKFVPFLEQIPTNFRVQEAPLQDYISNGDYLNGENWNPHELHAAVTAYLEMLRLELEGSTFTKKKYYDELSAKFGRTAKAFEFRMQNISYVLSTMGRRWLSGLQPAKNVGTQVAAKIEELITEIESKSVETEAQLHSAIHEHSNIESSSVPLGTSKPNFTTSTTTLIQRDSAVKEWVLRQAKGFCECCKQAAPFISPDGLPYLEVHHVKKLAENGSDTTTNAVAVCPNCHRELHYGERAKNIVEILYSSIPRLIRE